MQHGLLGPTYFCIKLILLDGLTLLVLKLILKCFCCGFLDFYWWLDSARALDHVRMKVIMICDMFVYDNHDQMH